MTSLNLWQLFNESMYSIPTVSEVQRPTPVRTLSIVLTDDHMNPLLVDVLFLILAFAQHDHDIVVCLWNR